MALFDRFKKPAPSPGGGDPRLAAWVAELGAEDWRVRKAAAEALGGLGAAGQPAVAALEEAISDEHGEVCLAASDALSKIRIASD